MSKRHRIVTKLQCLGALGGRVSHGPAQRRDWVRDRALPDQGPRRIDLGRVRRPRRAQRRHLRRLLVHGLPSQGSADRRAQARSASWPVSAPGRPTPRSSSTATSASGGASSGHPRRFHGSRTAPRTTRARPTCRTGGSPAASSARVTAAPACRRLALRGALDLIAGLGGGVVEGYPEDAAAVPAGFLYHGALSTFDQLGLPARPDDRQAPLGRRARGRGPTYPTDTAELGALADARSRRVSAQRGDAAGALHRHQPRASPPFRVAPARGALPARSAGCDRRRPGDPTRPRLPQIEGGGVRGRLLLAPLPGALPDAVIEPRLLGRQDRPQRGSRRADDHASWRPLAGRS